MNGIIISFAQTLNGSVFTYKVNMETGMQSFIAGCLPGWRGCAFKWANAVDVTKRGNKTAPPATQRCPRLGTNKIAACLNNKINEVNDV